MIGLEPLNFDPNECRRQVEELRDLLTAKKVLREKNDILPFFRARKHLSAYLGSYDLNWYDRIAHEFRIEESFICDLIVGDSKERRYTFVEFEDATPTSIFVKREGKHTPEWSRRFEHGFSQLVDWFYKLDDIRHTTGFHTVFGTEPIDYTGLLVVGRHKSLDLRERRRLEWRTRYVQIQSQRVRCITFDQLCDDLLDRLDNLRTLSGQT
jgi:hypothetical protein